MSYRNDHDAALARIDALEAELELLSRTAPVAPAPAPRKRSWMLPTMLGMVAVGSVGVLGIASARGGHAETERIHEAPTPVAAVPAPSMPTERAKLLGCVELLDAHIARHDASSSACLATINAEIGDAGLGTDIHATLVAWRSAESGHDWDDREGLAPKIHAYIIPSFTR